MAADKQQKLLQFSLLGFINFELRKLRLETSNFRELNALFLKMIKCELMSKHSEIRKTNNRTKGRFVPKRLDDYKSLPGVSLYFSAFFVKIEKVPENLYMGCVDVKCDYLI